MPLHDLTPQLRTRLSRMERAVGIFVAVAVLLLVWGFVYYLYHTAERKGWFLKKVPYHIFVQNAGGLKLGDPVKLMGFDVGEITEVTPMPPTEWFVTNNYNVFVKFLINEPNYGYIWTDSKVRVSAGDFLGKRVLEVTKGQKGAATVQEQNRIIVGILKETDSQTYLAPAAHVKGVWLRGVEESPAATEKLEAIVRQVESVLPGITNQLNTLLVRGTQVATNFNQLLLLAAPIATNLAEVTSQLRDFNGSLGRWLVSSNFSEQVQATLASTGATMTNVDTNLVEVVDKLSLSLDNLANLTSNLNLQVQSNTNILSEISAAVIHTDQFVEGLKRHWLLRSAFRRRKGDSTPPRSGVPPARSP